MQPMGDLWPHPDERGVVGRFYLAAWVRESCNVIWPFQFAYLFMVMERPEWAVIPLLAESAVALLAEVPTGALADRFGRRLLVVLGDLLSATALALVPLATLQSGHQLGLVSACFGLWGLGQAMVSGATQAWVVDNLDAVGRTDLVDGFFARSSSFTSLGAVGGGALALLVLLSLQISRPLLDALWYAAALGYGVGALIKATIPEHRRAPQLGAANRQGKGVLNTVWLGLRAIGRSRSLLYFVIALVIASFPESVADDAFDMSLITKGMDARGLAPLGILDNLIAISAPLVGLALLRRFGATPVLSLFLVVPAVAVSVLFVAPTLWILVVLYILLDFIDHIWDPLAEARLQRLITSDARATVSSIVSYAGGLMELLGIAVLALLLGEHSEQLSEIVPDLVTAFSGGAPAGAEPALTGFGLTVPDLAIVVLIASGLLALPFVQLSAKHPVGRPPGEC